MAKTVFLWGQPGQYPNYQRALKAAGAAVRLSQDLSGADRCSALLLPGGGDMEPWRYGQVNTASRGLEPDRDRAELLLLERFTRARKPVLGICRGMQVINVFFGGTLVQDLPGHGQAAGRDRLHRVRSAPYQAADRLGSGLRAVQWTADGTVEAVVHEDLPVWAVQWHPERLSGPLALAGAADGGRLFTAWLSLAAPGGF